MVKVLVVIFATIKIIYKIIKICYGKIIFGTILVKRETCDGNDHSHLSCREPHYARKAGAPGFILVSLT